MFAGTGSGLGRATAHLIGQDLTDTECKSRRNG
jgi:hypothetical protein